MSERVLLKNGEPHPELICPGIVPVQGGIGTKCGQPIHYCRRRNRWLCTCGWSDLAQTN